MEFHKIVAKNLYNYRKNYGISLQKLSKLTGVSSTSLNEIEKGRTIPSINTVWKISNGLKIPLNTLMNEKKTEYTKIDKNKIKPIIELEEKYKVFPYFPFQEKTFFEYFYVELEKDASLESEPHLLGSQEYLIVLNGKIQLILNQEVITLNTGDAVKFNSDIKHTYQNIDSQQSNISVVIHYSKNE